MKRLSPWLGAVSLVLVSACSNAESSGAGARTCEPTSKAETPTVRESLLWKRGGALTNDLGRALSLSQDELCTELGTTACGEVHRVALGSSDPFGSGLVQAVASPLATSAIATDRVALGACSKRVDLDAKDKPKVFTNIDLSSGDMPTKQADVAQFASDVGTLLYRRLLARVPTESELGIIEKLAVDADGKPVSKIDFVKLTCFAIATTSEFLLY